MTERLNWTELNWTRRVQERSKGDTWCPTTSQNPSRWRPSWLSNMCTTRRDPESEWLARDNLETHSISIKPKSSSHVANEPSWIPLPSCSRPRCPSPVKSFALLAHVSPQTIHFQVLDKSSPSGPERGPPSCNIIYSQTLPLPPSSLSPPTHSHFLLSWACHTIGIIQHATVGDWPFHSV